MTDPLLRTKLCMPPMRSELVRRAWMRLLVHKSLLYTEAAAFGSGSLLLPRQWQA
jgi:hypothetical protein